MDFKQVQAIIRDIARHSADSSFTTTRAEVVARMGDAGLSIPSESWLDAVTREAMQGREYVLDVATSPVEQADDPDLGEALKDAPAPLPAWPTAATVRLSPEDEPRTYPVSSGACDAKATAPRARPTLIALAALALACVAVAFRLRRRAGRHACPADVAS